MFAAANPARTNPTLVDTKGLGKLPPLKNTESEFVSWARRTENFVVSVHPGARNVLTWAVERDSATVLEANAATEVVMPLDTLRMLADQLYTVLMTLVEGDSFDILVGSGSGEGLEAWRRLHKRWDPLTTGRARGLLREILSPGRAKLVELQGAVGRLEDLMRRYTQRRDARNGQRHTLAEDIRMAALESASSWRTRATLSTIKGNDLVPYGTVVKQTPDKQTERVGTETNGQANGTRPVQTGPDEAGKRTTPRVGGRVVKNRTDQAHVKESKCCTAKYARTPANLTRSNLTSCSGHRTDEARKPNTCVKSEGPHNSEGSTRRKTIPTKWIELKARGVHVCVNSKESNFKQPNGRDRARIGMCEKRTSKPQDHGVTNKSTKAIVTSDNFTPSTVVLHTIIQNYVHATITSLNLH